MNAVEVAEATFPCAVLLDGPFAGRLVKVDGPYELHFEEEVEYRIVSRGPDTWTFPLRYTIAK